LEMKHGSLFVSFSIPFQKIYFQNGACFIFNKTANNFHP
jgi:hypothetical protein